MNISHPAVIGYMILVVAMLLGLWRVQTVATEVARLSADRADAVCSVQEQLRDIIRRLVVESIAQDDQEGLTPAEIERRNDFLDRSFELLDDAACPLMPRPITPTPEDET